MKKVDVIALLLLIFAGINWGLWGIFEFNLIGYIFGKEWIDSLIYFLLGISGIYFAVSWKAIGARWGSKKK